MHLNIADPHAGLFAHTTLAGTSGDRAPVVCLHSSSGSHSQWRTLGDALSARWHVVAPDLHGHGRSPSWPAEASSTLHVDAAAVVQRVGDLSLGVHLVGHSYGGAVAMQIALRYPQWVRSLTLYEPVAFGVIARMAPDDDALREIRGVADALAAHVSRGDLTGASQLFIDYWAGDAAWRRMNGTQQAAVRSRIATVVRHFEATLAARWGRETLARLGMPVLLMHGEATRAPARRIVELLSTALPHAQPCVVAGAGHLGPMTHAAEVNDCLVTHLDPALAAGTIRGFHVPHPIHDFDTSAVARSGRDDTGRFRAAA